MTAAPVRYLATRWVPGSRGYPAWILSELDDIGEHRRIEVFADGRMVKSGRAAPSGDAPRGEAPPSPDAEADAGAESEAEPLSRTDFERLWEAPDAAAWLADALAAIGGAGPLLQREPFRAPGGVGGIETERRRQGRLEDADEVTLRLWPLVDPLVGAAATVPPADPRRSTRQREDAPPPPAGGGGASSFAPGQPVPNAARVIRTQGRIRAER